MLKLHIKLYILHIFHKRELMIDTSLQKVCIVYVYIYLLRNREMYIYVYILIKHLTKFNTLIKNTLQILNIEYSD